ncbi:MAG: hypothetical protein AB7P04_06875 [Bacteriovoracia bacterium]
MRSSWLLSLGLILASACGTQFHRPTLSSDYFLALTNSGIEVFELDVAGITLVKKGSIAVENAGTLNTVMAVGTPSRLLLGKQELTWSSFQPLSPSMTALTTLNLALSPSALFYQPDRNLLFVTIAGTTDTIQVISVEGDSLRSLGSFSPGDNPRSVVAMSGSDFIYTSVGNSKTLKGYRIDGASGAGVAVDSKTITGTPGFLRIGVDDHVLITHASTPHELLAYSIEANSGAFSLADSVSLSAAPVAIDYHAATRRVAVQALSGEIQLYRFNATTRRLELVGSDHSTSGYVAFKDNMLAFDASGSYLAAYEQVSRELVVFRVIDTGLAPVLRQAADSGITGISFTRFLSDI